jgi:hypothetical protein
MFFKNKHVITSIGDCQDVLLPLEAVIDCGLEVLSFALTKANLIPLTNINCRFETVFSSPSV